MRAGAEYFIQPGEPAQRRYEALRCYFVEDASAEEVGARFGYSPATVHQLAAELRGGRTSFFRSSKPGPKGPRKTTTVRDRVLVLRAQDRPVTEIAQALTAEGSPVSAQTVWAILKSEGLERLARRGPGGPAPRLKPIRAKAIGDWPAGARYDCDHAGLYLLMPAMAELGLDTLVGAAGYPGTKVVSAFHSLGSLLLLKASRRGRAANAFPLGADPGLGLALGLAQPRVGAQREGVGGPAPAAGLDQQQRGEGVKRRQDLGVRVAGRAHEGVQAQLGHGRHEQVQPGVVAVVTGPGRPWPSW